MYSVIIQEKNRLIIEEIKAKNENEAVRKAARKHGIRNNYEYAVRRSA